MRLLFDDRLAPITSTIGFLETDAGSAAAAFERWHKPLWERRGLRLTTREVVGDLETALLSLLPLSIVERRRYLFIPTQSGWSAYIDNGAQGTDAVSVTSYLAQQIGCRGLRVTVVPNTIRRHEDTWQGRYGATVLEIYGPENTYFLNYIRAICALNDGGRWSFDTGGTPLPFEDLERYKARRIKDRFTPEMLHDYLIELGLHPFDENFYLPEGRATLVEMVGPLPPTVRELTLAEARARF